MGWIEIQDPLKLGVLVIVIGTILFLLLPQASPPASGSLPNESTQPLSNPSGIDKTGLLRAPEVRSIAKYFNTPESTTIESLKGKVVLIDFWDYSCINCIRTLPYLNDWYEKYGDHGLVILGVHAPEFEFEKKPENVAAAMEKYGIRYPVLLDNDFATWRAYRNRFWPAKYLIDREGFIRYSHFGEGEYEATEQKIVELLNEQSSGPAVNMDPSRVVAESPDFSRIQTPELYLGYDFARAPIGNPEGLLAGKILSYAIRPDAEFVPNTVYLDGVWFVAKDHVELKSPSGIVALAYHAKNVNIVAGSDSPSRLELELDQQPLPEAWAGLDAIADSNSVLIQVKNESLYNLVRAPDYENHVLFLRVTGSGFRLYTFTFG